MRQGEELEFADLTPEQMAVVAEAEQKLPADVRLVAVKRTSEMYVLEAKLAPNEWLRVEQINFDLGFGDTENLIEAVRANLEAEARYFEAVQQYNTAVLRLFDATGTLTQRIRDGMLLETTQGDE